jgi:DNA-binding MarR family transcriptional regulator
MTQVRWLDEREERAWRSMLLMQMHLTARLNHELVADAGLSYQDYAVLVALTDRADERMRLYELGTELGWEKSRLSHHISRMAERGLVSREKCESDRRGAFVVLTDAGRSSIEAAAPGHLDVVRRLFVDRLTPTQLDALADISTTVLAALADAGDPEGC